jgi:hypothetical protein
MDPNEFIVAGDIAVIVLFAKDGTKKGEAIIDVEDLPVVSANKWNLGTNGYVYSTQKKKSVLLHRLILVASGHVDHINRDPLDNRKSNLRNCTKSQNEGNTTLRRNNRSGYKGVYWDARVKKWRAGVAGKTLRAFDDPVMAAREYDHHAKLHFGEFAYLNGV